LSRPERRGRPSEFGRVVRVLLTTFVLAVAFSLLSGSILRGTPIFLAAVVLAAIILIGIVFDVIGLAVATADQAPLHAMAAKRTPGARQALRMVKNAPRVATIFNDLIGDICGTVSGAAGAAIIFRVAVTRPGLDEALWTVLMVAVIAALTVGGKAIGKTIALEGSERIVFQVGKVFWWLEERLGLVIFAEPTSRRNSRRRTNSR
jgi:CBS domain containing-hemolysin-like protein